MKKILWVLALCLFAEPVLGENVKVVDGDSLVVDGQMTRLIGIDAPEYFQKCQYTDGTEYECGKKALEYMRQMINEGQKNGDKLKCKKKDTDKYHRDLSICRIGKLNLNKKMVENGWAVAYRHKWYQSAQDKAEAEKRGIWQGKFMRPELYRILQKYQKTEK